ncbi:MAG: TolC family protein [Pseudomonadota bacterium]
MLSSVDPIDPSSEIASAVRSEYREFIKNAESDLGERSLLPEGNIVATGPSTTAAVEPRPPQQVEAIPRGAPSKLAYWEGQIQRQQTAGSRSVTFRVDDLLDRALARSNQLAAFSDIPLIRDAVVREREGRFDTFAFAEAGYERTDRIRSSTLETGTSSSAPNELEEDEFGFEVGLRQPLITGGEITLSQRIGGTDSNSEFFIPEDQADSEFRIELTQPLLDGAGIGVNTAPIQLARLERDQSIAELQRQIETQLIEVVRTYWALFAERGRVIQRERLIKDLSSVTNRIAQRSQLDALPGDVEQARAALKRAEASIIRAKAGVDNGEARLATQLSDPSLIGSNVEIIPIERPTREFVDVPLEDISLLALENRPEIRVAALQLRGAELRAEVAENQLLPDLDLFAAVSNGGLAGDFDFGEAYGSQFSDTDLDYEVGVRLEIPLGNITDRATYDRRRIEVRQLTSQLRSVADSVLLETQISVRELRAAHEEMRAREAELEAQVIELAALRRRADEGVDTGTAFLTNVVSAIEDRAAAEERLLDSVVAYNLALYTVERVAGTMLQVRDIGVVRVNAEALDYLTPVRNVSAISSTTDGGEPGITVNLIGNPDAIRISQPIE